MLINAPSFVIIEWMWKLVGILSI